MHVRDEVEPGEILLDPLGACTIPIERNQSNIGRLQYLAGFSAGRGAGIQHGQPVGQGQQGGRVLRGGVLHGYFPCGKTRHIRNWHRPGKSDATHADRISIDARGLQPLQVDIAFDTSAIDAQRHRRMRVACFQHALPAIGIAFPEPVDPPLRMAKTAYFAGERVTLQFVPTAQVIAQYGIDQPLRRTESQRNASRHCLIDDRVGGRPITAQFPQRAKQQCMNADIGGRPSQQACKNDVGDTVVTQGSVDNILHAGLPACWQRLGQTFAIQYASNGATAGGERFGKGWGVRHARLYRCARKH